MIGKNDLGNNIDCCRIRGIMKRGLIITSLISLVLANLAGALTLQESVDSALTNNPSVLAAQKKLEAAKAKLGQATGAFFPTVKLDANYSRAYTEPSKIQFTTQTSLGAITQTQTFGINEAGNIWGWTASINQPLFVAGLFPGFKMAQNTVDIAKQELRKTTQATVYNVNVAYFNLLTTEKFLTLASDSLYMAQSHLKQVETMLKSGVATRADYLRAEVQVANSEVALTQAKNNLELAKNSFNNILGRALEEPVSVSEETNNAKMALPDNAALLQSTFESRPDWLLYALNKSILAENVGLARSAYYPTLFLAGQTGNRVNSYPGLDFGVNSWQVAALASWTLFDGFSTQNRVKEAAANLEAQQATEEQVKNGIALEVRQAYLQLKTAVETIGSAKKAVNYAEENHKVSSLRFNSGVGTNLEEIDAQVALIQAKTNYFKAVFDLAVAKAKINYTVGKEVR